MTTLHPIVGDATATNWTKEAPDVRKLCASSLFHLCHVVLHKRRGMGKDGPTHAAHHFACHLLLHHDGDPMGGHGALAELALRLQFGFKSLCSLLATQVSRGND